MYFFPFLIILIISEFRIYAKKLLNLPFPSARPSDIINRKF